MVRKSYTGLLRKNGIASIGLDSDMNVIDSSRYIPLSVVQNQDTAICQVVLIETWPVEISFGYPFKALRKFLDCLSAPEVLPDELEWLILI
jgi:basic membrane lipoprotein Med (substrate-binding protein (PBP1-ABC) superfamily)